MKELVVVTHCDSGLDHPATEMIPFTYRGVHYELDACDVHGPEFDAHMSYLIDVARKAKRSPKRKQSAAPISVESRPVRRQRGAEKDGYEQRKKIRAWARESGWPDQSDIGIIKREVVDAYFAAHPDEVPS